MNVAVCYASDLNFLVPTLVSATRLRALVPEHRAAICCLLVDVDPQALCGAKAEADALGIRFLHIRSRDMLTFDRSRLRECHLSVAALGRLFIEPLLPTGIDRIVYFDGDTWFPRSPEKLIEAHVPEGRFAAADDSALSMNAHEMTAAGRFTRRYRAALGLPRNSGYFNSGVFAVSRATWKDIAGEALDYLCRNVERCHHYDQSALNAIMGERRLRLSSRWNFQTTLRDLDLEERIRPCVYHMTGFPKPWMGDIVTWRDIVGDIAVLAKRWAELGLPLARLGDEEIEAYNRGRQKRRDRLKTRLRFRYMTRRRRITHSERLCWL